MHQIGFVKPDHGPTFCFRNPEPKFATLTEPASSLDRRCVEKSLILYNAADLHQSRDSRHKNHGTLREATMLRQNGVSIFHQALT